MAHINKYGRREVLCGGGVAALAVGTAAVLPFVAKVKSRAPSGRDDPLAKGIQRYIGALTALDESQHNTDDELDADLDRVDAILSKAVGNRVTTAAGAIAVLDLYLADEGVFKHCRFQRRLAIRLREARNFLANAGEMRS